MADLFVTDVGRAVARSSLTPRTAAYFLDYFRRNIDQVGDLFEQAELRSENQIQKLEALDALDADVSFILYHLCFCSPEFGDDFTDARRFLPYPLGDRRECNRAIRLQRYLAVQPWDLAMLAVNAADMCTDWIGGVPLADLEGRFEGLRGGMVRQMLQTASSHLSGLADILSAACSGTQETPDSEHVEWVLSDPRRVIFRLIRRIRQYSIQSLVGLPEDVMWMVGVEDSAGQPLIRRGLAMEFRGREMQRIEDLLDSGRRNEFLAASGGGQGAHSRMQRIRQAASKARSERTETRLDRIVKLLPECEEIAVGYFMSYEKEFETYFELCLECVEFQITGRDDDENRKPRFPDFIIQVGNAVTLVIECKSSVTGKDIVLGAATDVGGKAALHALNDNHLITVCQKYVGTDVPRQIEVRANLSVVNAEDIALAMAFLKAKRISKERFVSWITTPGQPRAEELFWN